MSVTLRKSENVVETASDLDSNCLAGEMLDIENLAGTLIPIVEKYNQHKMCVVYQNPPPPSQVSFQSSFLHKNWVTLKDKFLTFRSQITQSNIERFRYDRLINGSPRNAKVYYDILYNEQQI